MQNRVSVSRLIGAVSVMAILGFGNVFGQVDVSLLSEMKAALKRYESQFRPFFVGIG